MKKPLTKKARIALGVLIAVLLIGTCFFCVSLYAKKEFNKPRFEIPDPPAHDDLTKRLTTMEDTTAFIERLYTEASQADDAEGSWHTDVSFDGEWKTPFSDADNSVLQFLGKQAEGEIGGFYPSADGVLMCESQDAPSPLLGAAVSDYTLEQAEGKDEREDAYSIMLVRDPSAIDTDRMTHSDVCAAITGKLSPAVEIGEITVTATGAQERYRLDHATDRLLSAELKYEYRIRARVRLTAPDVGSAQSAEIEVPYTTVQHIEFRHYGVRFTAGGVVTRDGEKLGLGLEVTTRDGESPENYTLSYTPSVPGVLKFDEDRMMTILKPCSEPIVVTVTMQYAGHTYSDSITVYITDLEVASGE